MNADLVPSPCAPETPGELLTLINIWQRDHECRPASEQQTAMTDLYSAIRALLPVHEGSYHNVQVTQLRAVLERAFPDLQQQVYDANRRAASVSPAELRAAAGTIKRLTAENARLRAYTLTVDSLNLLAESSNRALIKQNERLTATVERLREADAIVRQADAWADFNRFVSRVRAYVARHPA